MLLCVSSIYKKVLLRRKCKSHLWR